MHLKRFFFTRLRRDKLDVKVEFPLENWDLSAYLPPHQVCHIVMCYSLDVHAELYRHGAASMTTYVCRGDEFLVKIFCICRCLQQMLDLNCSMATESSIHGWNPAVFPVNRLL